MKTRAATVTFLIVLLLLLAQCASTQDIKTLFVRNNELFTLGSDGSVVQITHDGIRKDRPLWSKDGSKIAYLQGIDKRRALAELIVIGAGDWNKLSDILIRPTQDGVGEDMRFIESLEWLTPEHIAASGTINPSTEESLVIDINTGRELMNYYDDAGGVGYSPDGEHVAYVNGAPHFMPADESEPALNIDMQRVYPRPGVKVDFLSRALWTHNGAAVAIVVKDRVSQGVRLVTCGLDSTCTEVQIPEVPDERVFSLASSTDDEITIRSALNTWRFRIGTGQISQSVKPTSNSSIQSDLSQQASTFVSHLREQIREYGGRSGDFWCANCILAELARKTASQ
jgi:hypothetical protein